MLPRSTMASRAARRSACQILLPACRAKAKVSRNVRIASSSVLIRAPRRGAGFRSGRSVRRGSAPTRSRVRKVRCGRAGIDAFGSLAGSLARLRQSHRWMVPRVRRGFTPPRRNRYVHVRRLVPTRSVRPERWRRARRRAAMSGWRERRASFEPVSGGPFLGAIWAQRAR